MHSLVGILVFVAAFSIANKMSVSYSSQFAKAIEPMITGLVDNASMVAIGQRPVLSGRKRRKVGYLSGARGI